MRPYRHFELGSYEMVIWAYVLDAEAVLMQATKVIATNSYKILKAFVHVLSI